MTARRLFTSLTLLLASLVPALGLVSPAAAATTWVPTGTHALTLKSGTLVGALPANALLHISVALQIRNRAGLDQFIQSINTPGDLLYGDALTPAQFTEAYAPTSAQVQAVESYLKSEGMSSVAAEPNNLFVTATGTAAQVEAAFNTALSQYKTSLGTVYINTTAAQVPSTLAGTVVSVLGLNNVAIAMPNPQLAKPGAGTPSLPNYPASYTPQQFWKAYDVGSTPTGSKTAIAIITASNDSAQVISDLRTAEKQNGLPQVPVTVVPVGILTPTPSAVYTEEFDMDTQTSTGIAGTVSHLYLYQASTLTDSDLALDYNKWATQDVAKAGSASLGECEYEPYLDGAMVATDQVFAEAAAQGQTFFASAGDTGGFCSIGIPNGVPAGAPDVNYPASSPYVVGVGGTTLITNSDGTYDTELAWTAGGGGPSEFENQPYWQSNATPPSTTSCTVYLLTCLGKNVPDVAMDADPNSGATVYINGQEVQGAGGTSLASPLSLGVWARLESAHSNKLGFAAPNFYATYKNYPFPQTGQVPTTATGFHDVIAGNTGPYEATPGWDYATGLGSFDITQINKHIVPPAAPPVKVYKFTSPICNVASDPMGDVTDFAGTGQTDALDILAVGFQSTTTSIIGKLMVKSLNDGPGGTPEIGGMGDNWYVTWKYNGTEYFLNAQFPGSSVDPNNPALLVSYNYGSVTTSPTGGTLYNTVGAATGSFDVAHGVITLTAPRSVFGSPKNGAALTLTGAATFESVGTPAAAALETADSAGPGTNYTVGSHC